MVKLLITGNKGLLGTELIKHLDLKEFEIFGLDRPEFDITKKDSVKEAFKKFQPEVVLHLAAYTDVAAAEYARRECYQTNVHGTELIATRAPFLIYMSTEYVFDGEKGDYHESSIPNPVNFYSLTKLLGEFKAERARRYCIVRTLFKPRPFEHPVACTDMWTSGDYVDVMAKKLALAILNYKTLPKVLHLGTGRKNLFELASQTKKDLKPIKRISLPIRLPRDTSLDTTLWEMLKYERPNSGTPATR